MWRDRDTGGPHVFRVLSVWTLRSLILRRAWTSCSTSVDGWVGREGGCGRLPRTPCAATRLASQQPILPHSLWQAPAHAVRCYRLVCTPPLLGAAMDWSVVRTRCALPRACPHSAHAVRCYGLVRTPPCATTRWVVRPRARRALLRACPYPAGSYYEMGGASPRTPCAATGLSVPRHVLLRGGWCAPRTPCAATVSVRLLILIVA